MVSEISPMELMDSPPTVVDDDVFVNLDAFDMLGDFPELEVLDHSGNSSSNILVCAWTSHRDFSKKINRFKVCLEKTVPKHTFIYEPMGRKIVRLQNEWP